MLRTRHRKQRLLQTCLDIKQALVIDNTNPTQADRQRYIPAMRKAAFRIIGYYFRSQLKELLQRNQDRPQDERLPDHAVISTYRRLELPAIEEGFDSLFYVQSASQNSFQIQEWRHDL